MIVEDESVVAVGIRAMIQDAGHEVLGVAHSGEEGIAMVENRKPDVVVVDVKLPGIDGIETTRRLVEEYNTPVIILTAYADPEFIEGAASAGASTYLLKPVSKESLCANLELAVARAHEFAQLRREVEDMRAALEVRKLAERAKHVLMERLALSEADAYAHLRQKCRNQNKTMRQVGEEILAAHDSFMEGISSASPGATKRT
jgi:response regulator NasT